MHPLGKAIARKVLRSGRPGLKDKAAIPVRQFAMIRHRLLGLAFLAVRPPAAPPSSAACLTSRRWLTPRGCPGHSKVARNGWGLWSQARGVLPMTVRLAAPCCGTPCDSRNAVPPRHDWPGRLPVRYRVQLRSQG